jgi:hypothetical protein
MHLMIVIYSGILCKNKQVLDVGLCFKQDQTTTGFLVLRLCK